MFLAQGALFIPLPAYWMIATQDWCELVLGSSHSRPFGILFEKWCTTILLPEEKAGFSDTGSTIVFYVMNTQ